MLSAGSQSRFEGTLPKALVDNLDQLDGQGKLTPEIVHKAISLTGIEPDSCNDEEYSRDLDILTKEVETLLP